MQNAESTTSALGKGRKKVKGKNKINGVVQELNRQGKRSMKTSSNKDLMPVRCSFRVWQC